MNERLHYYLALFSGKSVGVAPLNALRGQRRQTLLLIERLPRPALSGDRRRRSDPESAALFSPHQTLHLTRRSTWRNSLSIDNKGSLPVMQIAPVATMCPPLFGFVSSRRCVGRGSTLEDGLNGGGVRCCWAQLWRLSSLCHSLLLHNLGEYLVNTAVGAKQQMIP